ncbi:ABC transporter substrate-binding protein [Brevibacillus parabrevis]|uniref:ABC transporter substrate-binding protein n=1 Tax=Brevibacillus parabrevis TaxID=54914 RepID=UPI0028D70E86|nr:ABC transporter substrate-binding protein [Brevibacillus parabrevis]
MIQARPLITSLQAVFFSAALLLSGCGQSTPTPAPTDAAQQTAEAPATAKGAAATTQPTGDSQKQTRLYKDFMNREVEIPAHAERVIFIGNTAGDLLALGVKPVGLNMIDAKPTVFGGELQGVEDVGHPGDPEKMLALNPDLIMLDNGVSFEEFSKERLGEVAGDRLFLMVSLDDSKTEFERFIENPLWKNLPAVQNGDAYLVDAK